MKFITTTLIGLGILKGDPSYQFVRAPMVIVLFFFGVN
jgi:hypothetical protein